MAAGEEAWKVRVRDQAAKAAGRCARAHGLLAGAHGLLTVAIGDLETPTITDSPEAWRVAAARAEGELAAASGELAAAALVALRGGAASPETPLRSVDDVPNEALRASLALLGEATDRAEDACDFVGVCRAYLVGVGRLLGHPLLPGLKGLVNVKLVSARDELENAQGSEEVSTGLVNDALLTLLLI